MDAGNLFSIQAKDYARYRPKYPEELFKFLNSIVPGHEYAWDCATGNGQAAIGLVPYFNQVLASDISKEQLANSFPHPKIKYFEAHAENSSLESSNTDLITVSTAIHWINTEKFFKEVERILKPNGIIAVWNYTRTLISEHIDKVVDYYVYDILGDNYWPEKASRVFEPDFRIELPFKNLPVPEINMEHQWTLHDMVKYIYTWSATQAFILKNKSNPIDLIYNEIKKAWGDENQRRKVRWKFLFAVNRLE